MPHSVRPAKNPDPRWANDQRPCTYINSPGGAKSTSQRIGAQNRRRFGHEKKTTRATRRGGIPTRLRERVIVLPCGARARVRQDGARAGRPARASLRAPVLLPRHPSYELSPLTSLGAEIARPTGIRYPRLKTHLKLRSTARGPRARRRGSESEPRQYTRMPLPVRRAKAKPARETDGQTGTQNRAPNRYTKTRACGTQKRVFVHSPYKLPLKAPMIPSGGQ